MTKSDCSSCRFFIQNPTLNIGSCRRYPVYQNRHGSEWCGEHALAHYDLPDTIENLVANAELEEELAKIPVVTIEKQKNKGNRPRKVTRI